MSPTSKSAVKPASRKIAKSVTQGKQGAPIARQRAAEAGSAPKKSTRVKSTEAKAKGEKTAGSKRDRAKQSATVQTKTPRRPSPATLQAIFSAFHTMQPEPKGELEHVNAYTLLVAVVLSAQATDAGVNKATRALFKAADTPAKMLALGEDAVREHIKTIGLFRNKAKNVIALSQLLIERHSGVVPADRDALTALPGVGRKTANVVLNMAFGEKTMAVDTHVFRVAHRLALSNGKTPDAVEDDLMKIIPDDYLFHAHHWLILHGRYTCVARNPKCSNCVIAAHCPAPDKQTA